MEAGIQRRYLTLLEGIPVGSRLGSHRHPHDGLFLVVNFYAAEDRQVRA